MSSLEANTSHLTNVSVDGGIQSNSDRTESNSTNTSFATIVKESRNKFQFPERDQAIVFDAIDNTKKNDYIVGVGGILGPRNILFASRVSNGRICIYLSSKELVEKFMSDYQGITINDVFIGARRLVSPAKRIILSNVSPCIPHDIVEKELKRSGLKVVSSITFIKAGMNLPEYSHILSFRRQVYVVLEDNDRVPDSLLIEYKQNFFRIFLTNDELKCFICKKPGHIANKCLEQSSVRNEVDQTQINMDTDANHDNTTEQINLAQAVDMSSKENDSNEIKSKKRQAPGSPESQSTENVEELTPTPDTSKNPFEKVFVKPQPKKTKTVKLTDDSTNFTEFI